MANYSEAELKVIKECYEYDLLEHDCGYWSVCIEKACPCHLSAKVNQGFDIETWDKLRIEMDSELIGTLGAFDDGYPYDDDEDYDDDDDW